MQIMFLTVARTGLSDGEIVVYSAGERGVSDNRHAGTHPRHRNYEEI